MFFFFSRNVPYEMFQDDQLQRLYTLSDALIQCVADTLPLDHDAKVPGPGKPKRWITK